MKRIGWMLAVGLVCGGVAVADIVVPSDGSDGELYVTTDTVIDLSQAVAGNWDDDNSANAGRGIYDSNKWAVVFKYTNVTVDAGATVTFNNHPSRAPVVWLVSGDVTINGTVNLKGQNRRTAPNLAEPGPGGFRGGMSRYSSLVLDGAGFGPGGGRERGGGGYGADGGSAGGSAYGNPSILPLIGGSGGGGYPTGGGAGGGAILIACTGTFALDGTITVAGGNGGSSGNYPPGGSGGAVRLVVGGLLGSGNVLATGGTGYGDGAQGRIRLERVTDVGTVAISPEPSIVALESGATPLIWPPYNAPTVRIVSVGGESSPADPRASFGIEGADVMLMETNTASVVVETTNVEEVSTVQVRVTPRANSNYSSVDATVDEVVSTDPLVVRWVADIPIKAGYSAIQVKVVRP